MDQQCIRKCLIFLSITLLLSNVRSVLGAAVVSHRPQDVVQTKRSALYSFCKIAADLQVEKDQDQGWIYGDYQCEATNQHGHTKIVIELINATAPGIPQGCTVIEETPTMVVLAVEPPISNGGNAINRYRVDYERWYQDFEIDEEIKIEDLRPSTSYTFGIRAMNEVGIGPVLHFSHTTEDVGPTTADPGLTVEITPGDAEIRRAVGTSLGRECSVRGLPADVIPHITWYTNGTEVGDDSRVFVHSTNLHSKKLYLFDIDDTDSGIYWCEVSNGGYIVRRAVTIVVLKDIIFYHALKTQYPWSGTDALIHCEASGDPAPTVWWCNQGKVIMPGGRYVYELAGLRIYNITRADTGLYTCVAEVAAEGRVKENLITVIVRG